MKPLKIMAFIRNMKPLLEIMALIMVALGTIIFIIFICKASNEYTICGNNIDYGVTGQFGDYIGGVVGTIFALAGTLILYLTLKEQLGFNKEQLEFNKRQHLINDYNLMLSMITQCEKLVREFKIDITGISDEKGKIIDKTKIKIDDLENIKDLSGKKIEEDDFMKIYKKIQQISDLCLLAFQFIKKYSKIDSVKESYKSIFVSYSQYVCSFWGLCLIEEYNKSSKIEIHKQNGKRNTLEIKQKEILSYIDDFKKYILDDEQD